MDSQAQASTSGDRLPRPETTSEAPSCVTKNQGDEASSAACEAAARLGRAGKTLQAIQAYRDAGAPERAARLASNVGRHEQAARCYIEAGQPYQAAACFVRAKLVDESLEQLFRVPPESPHYRSACVHAIRLCHRAGSINRSALSFVGGFLEVVPVVERERQALFLLAETLERVSLFANARAVYERLLNSEPDQNEARLRLRTLEKTSRTNRREFREIIKDRRAKVSPKTGVGEAVDDHQYLGQVLSERYRLEALLGAGGMAAVYRATDLQLNEPVALKLFRPLSGNQRLLQRFKRELAVTRKLTHPNVVRVHDIGGTDRQPFMTMELLEGEALSEIIDRGMVDIKRGVSILAQACRGLSAVHAEGIVHRDIKPENLFVGRDDVVKLMDFGIAKQDCKAGLTAVGFVAGSPAYIAPEQIRDFGGVSPSADIYALGVVAYHLFTGQLPFEEGSIVALLFSHCTRQAPSARAIRPHLPQMLDELILSALDKDPLVRPANAEEFRRRLLEATDTLPG